MMKAVIMAGGSGTRLWPTSRAGHPKQFLCFDGNNTMLQTTIKRLSKLKITSSITICNEEHRFFVAEQLREIDQLGSIILEPVGRNTAPTIAIAALLSDSDDLLLVLAADHIIQNESAFSDSISHAIQLADSDMLVSFGIVPDSPNPNYGYIKKGKKIDRGYKVSKFYEKPSIIKAKHYLESGDYFWNSGIFLFKAGRYLEELRKFRPDILEFCENAVRDLDEDLDFLRIKRETFIDCPSESIDYAVMEKTKHAAVVPMNAGWNDIGSWTSLWELGEKDKNGNVVDGDVILKDTQNSLVRTEGKLIAALGLNNIVVVSTKDAVMIAHKDHAHNAKDIAKKLKDENRPEWKMNREVYRPWGKYDSIDRGAGYQVKRITVNPSAKLSVQMHNHRAEHWVVVSGVAKVTNGSRTFILNENESTYIPVGTIHSLENPGNIPLQLIEVQSGSYLEEDDIIRFEDIYGRISKSRKSSAIKTKPEDRIKK